MESRRTVSTFTQNTAELHKFLLAHHDGTDTSEVSCSHTFRPCCTVQQQYLQDALLAITGVCDTKRTPVSQPMEKRVETAKGAGERYRQIPTIQPHREKLFEGLRPLNLPIMLEMLESADGLWQPEDFMVLYGNSKVEMTTVPVNTGEATTRTETTLGKYLTRFMDANASLYAYESAVKVEVCVYNFKLTNSHDGLP